MNSSQDSAVADRRVIGAWVDVDLARQLNEIARAEDRSTSSLVRRVLRQYVSDQAGSLERSRS
jgi:predicted transcriptional regulator